MPSVGSPIPYAPQAPNARAVAALCIGGMVLARGIDDAAFSREIREAARMLALEAGGRATA